MVLEANRWTYQTITHDDPSEPYYHASPTTLIEVGWHDNYSGGEAIMVRKNTTNTNGYAVSTPLMRVEEEWEYDAHGAPPVKYKATTYGRVYLPKHGSRAYRKLEEIEEDFYPYTSFQEGHNNLSRVKRVSGYVIYDQHVDRDSLDADAENKLSDRGMSSNGGDPTFVVDSARTWREAMNESGVIDDTPQYATWVGSHTTETEFVLEEPDKYCITGTRKIHIRDAPPEILGPTYQRKEGFQYSLSVPITPPELTGFSNGDQGNTLEIQGGGAEFGGRPIRVERYKIMRRVVSEPLRSSSDDPFDIWDTPPALPDRYRIFGIDSTTDLTGAPDSPLPSADGYSEPGDASETDADGWVVIAELDNTIEGVEDEGYATYLDDDVVNSAVYEYIGVAIISGDQSEETQPLQLTYDGATTGSGIVARVHKDRAGSSGPNGGVIEVDVIAPNDPDLQADEYGETVIFDMPVDLESGEAWSYDLGTGWGGADEYGAGDYDPSEYDPSDHGSIGYGPGGAGAGDGTGLSGDDLATGIGASVAGRQMAKNNRSRLDAKVVVTLPLLTLERGQLIKLESVDWSATNSGQDVILESSTESGAWILDGWELTANRDSSGNISGVSATPLSLMEP